MLRKAMRKLGFIIVFLCHGLCLHAQSYIGTITAGNYTQGKVKAQITTTPQGGVAVTLFHVKFARMMPVRLNVTIPSLTISGTRLTGENIVPTGNNKRYEKYLVRNFDGTADRNQLAFTCLMGKETLTFKGIRKK